MKMKNDRKKFLQQKWRLHGDFFPLKVFEYFSRLARKASEKSCCFFGFVIESHKD